MINLEILKQQNNLTTDEQDNIIVVPIDKVSFTTFPITETDATVPLTVEEYLGFRAGYYQFQDDMVSLEERPVFVPEENIIEPTE